MITDEIILDLSNKIDNQIKHNKTDLYIRKAVLERISTELTFSTQSLTDYDCFARFKKDRYKAEAVLVDNCDTDAVAQELTNEVNTIETNDLYPLIGNLGEVFGLLNDAIDTVYQTYQNNYTDCLIKGDTIYLTERNVIQMFRQFMKDNQNSKTWSELLKSVKRYQFKYNIHHEQNIDQTKIINCILDCAFSTYNDNGFSIGIQPFSIDDVELRKALFSFAEVAGEILSGSTDIDDDLTDDIVQMNDPQFGDSIEIDMSSYHVDLNSHKLSQHSYDILQNLIYATK